jgi:hypothetical protein
VTIDDDIDMEAIERKVEEQLKGIYLITQK